MTKLKQNLRFAGLCSVLACAACAADVDPSSRDLKTAVVRQALLSCSGKPATLSGTKDYYVAPASEGGDDDASGTCDAPLATLQAAHDALLATTSFDEDYRIWIRGGTYYRERVIWTKMDLEGDHKIAIESYPGEVATFDGGGERTFVKFRTADTTPNPDVDNPSVNVTIRRLHVTNYASVAIAIRRVSKVTVENSWFTNIGNRWWPTQKYGLGPIHMDDADNCIIRNNVFSHIENLRTDDNKPTEQEEIDEADPAKGEQLKHERLAEITFVHVAYVANDSDGNLFENNYVEHCSGDPFKTRNGSDLNRFVSNVTLWSGSRAFLNTQHVPSVSCEPQEECEGCEPCEKCKEPDQVCKPPEEVSQDNVLAGNVALFPYPEYLENGHSVDDLSWCTNPDCDQVKNASGAETPYMDSTGYLYPLLPDYEEVTAATQADVDNDGRDELFVAFRYPAHSGFVAHENEGGVTFPAVPGLSLVLRTDRPDDRVLRRVVYKSDFWTEIPALAGSDFAAGGADEVIAAFQNPSSTKIYRGNGRTSLTNHGELYADSSSPPTRVTALAGGNFKGGSGFAGHEVVAAIKSADDTERLWRGDGKGAVTTEQLWSNTASPWTGHHVGALAAVNPDSTSLRELAVSLHSSDATYLLWNLNTGLDSLVYSDTGERPWRIRSLVAARDPSGVDELYAGMEYWNVGRTYYFSDLVSGAVIHPIYSGTPGTSDRYWDTPAMARRSLGSCTEVISILSGGGGDKTFVYAGDKSSISAHGIYYRADLSPPSGASSDPTALPHRTREDTIAKCP